jgi:hypothetical protein
VRVFLEPAAFAAIANPPLLREEAANCLPLGIVHTLVHEPSRFPIYHLWTLD